MGRIEQGLRDLELGAVGALRAYNRRHYPESPRDPVTDAWMFGHHPDARRLVQHARNQYETEIRLSYSARPWATVSNPPQQISGTPGLLWHVRFHARGRYLRLPDLWRDSRLDAAARQLVLHVLSDAISHVEFTFPAVEDPTHLADAIGNVFDAVLETSSAVPLPGWDDLSAEPPPAPRPDDSRVLVGTPWNIVDDTTEPIVIFSA